MKSKWPNGVDGKVLLKWRTELVLTRKAAARLLEISISILSDHEFPERKTDRSNRWRANNHERACEQVRQYRRRRRLEDPDAVRTMDREASRRFRKNNPESRKRTCKKYADANKDVLAAQVRVRLARNYAANGYCSATQATARIALYGGVCAYCKRAPHHDLDHVIPLSRGGSNWPANLRPACIRCNRSKNDRLLCEWQPDFEAVTASEKRISKAHAVGRKRERGRKLTSANVMEIKKLLAAGVRGSVIAEQFHVTHNNICSIKFGRTWNDVSTEAP